MLEEDFQTADTQPGEFPWSAPISLAAVALVFGVTATMAVVFSEVIGTLRSIVLVVTLAVFLGERSRNLRRAVRAWQLHYGKAVEYVARRVRESEDGLRFKAP